MADFKKIEKRWQSKWEKSKIFQTKESKKKKYYVLEMYSYPSGTGLHMGHARNYIIADIYARYKRMNNFNVLYPVGYDSFGLPAENAAIKAKSHPKIFTEKAIENFIKQQKLLGLSYDWSRLIYSHSPEYYKWDQWLFLKLFKEGLVYKKKSAVNWCPKCNTVLANEQVINGKCWRHQDTNIEIKELNQWFFKITKYAPKLLKGLEKLDWPEDIKLMQKNWIGKSEGTLVNFKLETGEIMPIFTTRPDTLFGVTFMVFAPEHPKVLELVKGTKYEKSVKKFINKVILQERFTRTSKEKEGMFIGKYAINPINNEKIPIYIANFVLLEYGTGFIMAVPAHDQRDFEFAKEYNIPLKIVITPKSKKLDEKELKQAYIEDGILINSGIFNGLENKKAIEKITKYLEKKKLGKKIVQYKLRDWLISRQRYWGCPIPIIYCKKCGIVPVPEKDLPVKLPEKVSFTGKGNPLASIKNFVNTKCPKCNLPAKRETDTMDTFVDSSWYFLRYCDPKNSKKIFDPKKANYWMPIDLYIGGKEHACGHLIYFRFITKFLYDINLIKVDEPAKKLFNQGLVCKDGYAMSKSRGNIVNPLDIINQYNTDTIRLYLMFVAAPNKDLEWSDKTINSIFKFIKKLFSLKNKKFTKESKLLSSFLNRTIKEVTYHIENLEYNLAIIKLMELTNYLYTEEISKNAFEILLKLFAPFIPHTCEELWHNLKKKTFISLEKWPSYNSKKINEKVEQEYELIQKTIYDTNQILNIIKAKQKKPKKVNIYVVPKELKLFKDNKEKIKKKLNLDIKIYSVADSKKHDPENKSKKAKPGKPAIYIE